MLFKQGDAEVRVIYYPPYRLVDAGLLRLVVEITLESFAVKAGEGLRPAAAVFRGYFQEVGGDVIALEGEKVTLLGDGNIAGTEECTLKDVMGTVIEIGRGRRTVKPGKGRVWRALKPFR